MDTIFDNGLRCAPSSWFPVQIESGARRVLEVVLTAFVVAVETLEPAECGRVLGFEKAQVPFAHGCITCGVFSYS